MMTKLTLEQHEFDVLKEMVDERYQKLLSILSNKKSVLDDYEKDITNYTTYDLHVKLMEVKWWIKRLKKHNNYVMICIT